MAVSYKELGFVNTKEMFAKAMKEGFAVPAYNFNNMEQLQAIITACQESRSPVILQVSKGARDYANATLLRWMGRGAIEMMKEMGAPVPVALHLDHGDSFELCKSCIESGFSSVMIDGSHLPYEENIALTRKVVEYARQHDVTVEGELGVLAGIEDEVSAEHHTYTDPAQVEDFVNRTGVDSLAISIGTSHGAYKFKVKPGEDVPPLRFDILEEVSKRLPGFPIVLHGASSVDQDAVAAINKYGGKLENAVGVPAEQLRKAAKSAVCKINVDSDGRLVMTAAIRKVFAEKPSEFDPRKYLGPARADLIAMYKNKNENVLGSAGRY
ncbi:MAG: class II fructose-1,6-bisphosphate aldolase [Elusimicrobiota bacterium]|jgi:fructose-bisphosphate aldolase class II|nr:class II fructose-1,6-bisphosphate aldolase [Elusimicrobiota bacterium]